MFRRVKEEYVTELKESEGSLHELKRKLKEARSEIQDFEELVSKLRTQTTQFECQLTTAKQVFKLFNNKLIILSKSLNENILFITILSFIGHLS